MLPCTAMHACMHAYLHSHGVPSALFQQLVESWTRRWLQLLVLQCGQRMCWSAMWTLCGMVAWTCMLAMLVPMLWTHLRTGPAHTA